MLAHVVHFADALAINFKQPLRLQKLLCPCLRLMRTPLHRLRHAEVALQIIVMS